MRRREFVKILGAAAVTMPHAVLAQQETKTPIIGWLRAGVQTDRKSLTPTSRTTSGAENAAAFVQGLQDVGYVNGLTARIEERSYGASYDLVNGLAEELVRMKCSVIFASNSYAIKATLNATDTIPIVGVDLESDPVANGWVFSLSRPGGNLTGIFLDIPDISGKQIGLLKETLPALRRLSVFWDPATGAALFRATEVAARATGTELQSLPIKNYADLDDAFGRAKSAGADGAIVLSSPFLFRERVRIAELALDARLPTMSLFTQFPKDGGLMAYGPNLPDMFKRSGIYVGRIIKGAKAAELPIERPTRFDLVINLKIAKVLGLTIPESFLLRADEVIE